MRYRSRKYDVNEDFFKSVVSEQQAYLLGLLVSDGWVRNDGVGLSSTDLELCELMRDTLSSSHLIREKLKKKPHHQTQYELFIGSNRISSDLQRLGCGKSKSLTACFPQEIPGDLVHHFIRGLWDGDGMIRFDHKSNARMSIVGTSMILDTVSNELREVAGISTKVTILANGVTAKIHLSGNHKGVMLRQYLYRDATVCLQRKRSAFFNIQTKYNKEVARREPS